MREPVIVQVVGFDQTQHGDPLRIEEGYIPFYAGADYPLRLISMTTRFDLRAPMHRMEQRLRALDKRAALLAPVQHVVRAWESPRSLAGVLNHLPAAARQLVTAGVADAVSTGGGGGVAVLDELAAPDILAAYLDSLPEAQRALLIAALGEEDPEGRESWEMALRQLNDGQWKRRWLKEYRGMYDRLTREIALRGLRHYLIAWPETGVRADDYASSVARAFGTAAFCDELPPFLQGRYFERARWSEDGSYLEPEEPHLPYAALMTASGPLRGRWDTMVLHRMLNLDLDVAVAVDIQPVPRSQLEMQLSTRITAREKKQERGEMSADARARNELSAAYVMQEELATQSGHDLRVVVGVLGESVDDLNANVRVVKQAGGMQLNLMRVQGQQGALTKFFSTAITKQIDARTLPHRALSHAAAVMTPFGLRKPDRTDGIIWLFEGATPIMFNPFRTPQGSKRAAHMVVLGKTGSGKTYALQTWAMRLLAEDVQIVVYEPQGHFRRLVGAAGSGGARFILNLDQCLNVLDIIAFRGEEGEPPSVAMQVEHVITQLSILLGKSVPTGEGKASFQARNWTDEELDVLNIALQRLYAPWAEALDALRPEHTPLLADLCRVFDELAKEMAGQHPEHSTAARKIAANVRFRLVESSYGRTFNAHTTVDWDFSHAATSYDFSQIPDGPVRIFYYAQAFGALNRAIRAPLRDRTRPILAIIDEFRYMASLPSLARFAADATKTWRTFGAGIVCADQDAHTYLGTENGTPDEAMLSVWNNSTTKVVFLQDAADANRIVSKIQGLQPFHADLITRMPLGECVMVVESGHQNVRHNEVYVGRVVANDGEHRAFDGT